MEGGCEKVFSEEASSVSYSRLGFESALELCLKVDASVAATQSSFTQHISDIWKYAGIH